VLATVLAGRPAQMEATCARPDGTLVTWQVMANPLFDEEGQVRRFVAIAVDISERKRAEQVLSETIARLTAVNEIARAVASTLDQDSVMRIVLREVQRVVPSDGMCLIMAEPGGRRARIIGTQGDMAGDPRLGPGEYLDMSFLALDEVILQGRQVYRPDMRSLTQPVFIRLLESGLLSSVSVPIVSDHLPLGCLIVGRSQVDAFDQRELELLQSLAPHLAAAIKNAQAYDQLRTARAELQKAQEQMIRTERLRSIGEVAGGVAHDFNNLLGVILSRTQVLLQQCQDPQTQLSLQAVEKAARDGRDTVKRIQQFVGRHSEEGQVVADLDEIVKGALHLTAYRWKDQAEREGLPLVMQVDLGAAPLVRVNPVEIREVLVNLILNACDALPAGGQITVRTGASAGSGWLQVTDNGIGMDDATVPQVFDLFFTTKGENNTGLGLAVSEGIVQRHGGRIEVESRLGQGTTFTVSLPLADGPPGEQEAEVSDTRPAESLQVLVVDDDPMVLGAMQEALDTLGYATRGAADGRAAVALAQQQRFDVVVTDLGMPGMSGWQVAEEIKRLSPQTQVMILTGWGDTIEPTRFVDETLTKPVELSALREVMVRAAARKAA
jgi:signal transduction histidine kinase/CheY-like chemotaxis protein